MASSFARAPASAKTIFCQFIAAQPAVRRDRHPVRRLLNFGERGLAGADEFAREFVGVHDPRWRAARKAGGGGFAHAHVAVSPQSFICDM